MEEDRTYKLNAVTRSIEALLKDVRELSEVANMILDPRVKAIVITKLEEAALWSHKLLR